MNLFSKKKEGPKVPDPLETMMELDEQLEIIDKKNALLETRIKNAEQEALKRMKKNDKKGALNKMKEKKILENQIQQSEGMRMQLLIQKEAIANSRITRTVVQALDKGNRAMAGIRGEWDADKVHDVMEATQEEMDIQNEIADAFSHRNDGFDEDDLMAELEGLVDDSVSVDVTAPELIFPAAPGSVFVLPEAPRGAVQAGTGARASANAETEEQKQLRELLSEMG